MLTLTPPESKEDETQTDETDKRSPHVNWRTRLRRMFFPTPEEARAQGRDNEGFSLLELVIAVAIIASLSVIGFAIYSGITDDAEDTALDANIATAAEQVQFLLSDDPTIFGTGSTGPQYNDFLAAISDRTDFEWASDQYAFASTDQAGLIRVQALEAIPGNIALSPTGNSPVRGDSTTSPRVRWLIDTSSAVRLHMRNDDGNWRCALVISKPSVAKLTTSFAAGAYATGAVGLPAATHGDGSAAISTPIIDAESTAKLMAAQLRGVWYDGGSDIQNNGVHNCLPTIPGGAADAIDNDLPDSNRLWVIPDATGTPPPDVDATSILIDTSANPQVSAQTRTLHGSVGGLDSPS